MPPRPILSEQEERAEQEDQEHLRSIDSKLDHLYRKRQELIVEMRRLSSEQRSLYDRRQAPQAEVEILYREHGDLGKRIVELRRQRDAARQRADEALIHLREVRLSIGPADRLRPDHLRREIAQLELRQQTHALSLDDENALIATLRQRTKELKEAEARTAVVAEHERVRKEAEAAATMARGEVERLSREMIDARDQRDARMAQVRSKLEAAGGLIAELRAKGRARAEAMGKVDAASREIAEIEQEGRKILGQVRARREEARRTLRTYSRPHRPTEDLLASTAEAQLEELLKRGKITLGG